MNQNYKIRPYLCIISPIKFRWMASGFRAIKHFSMGSLNLDLGFVIEADVDAADNDVDIDDAFVTNTA